MPTAESIHADIDQAVTPGFRARLITRGQARAMIWRDGVLPPGAPGFSSQLSYDLHSYGYSLLELGLRLLELGGDPARDLTHGGEEREVSVRALHSLIGDPGRPRLEQGPGYLWVCG